MRRLSCILAIGLILTVTMIPATALGITITPNYDANVTQAQKDIIDAKIALWEGRINKNKTVIIAFENMDLGTKAGLYVPGVELIRTAEERATLAETDDFTYDGDGDPSGATIRINSNPSISWHLGGVPIAAGKYDLWTVINHEMAHALGFTINSPNFSPHVTAGPGDKRTFTLGPLVTTLTPEADGTHLDPQAHPNCLMNPTLGTGERRTPNRDEIGMVGAAWSLFLVPSLTEWGLIVLLMTLILSAAFVLYRRRGIAVN